MESTPKVNLRRAELLDAADTEEDRGNLATAAELRAQADALIEPWERLHVAPYDAETYLVESQTREDVRHIVDPVEGKCSCEWALDFCREGTHKKRCAHLKRVRQWLQEQKTGH